VIEALERRRGQIAEACARHRVLRLDAFGSAVHGEFRPDESDVDLLVDFAPMDAYARVDAYFDLLDDLRGILGTKVDLVMVDAVKNRYIAADIERTKQAFVDGAVSGDAPVAIRALKRFITDNTDLEVCTPVRARVAKAQKVQFRAGSRLASFFR